MNGILGLATKAALAMMLAAMMITVGMGIGAPSAYALPDTSDGIPNNVNPCSLTINGEKVWFGHGQIITDARGNRYQCNNGKWEKVNRVTLGVRSATLLSEAFGTVDTGMSSEGSAGTPVTLPPSFRTLQLIAR